MQATEPRKEQESDLTVPRIANAIRRRNRQRPWPRSVRLPDELDSEVTRYLDLNGINFNQLCSFALEKFMREPQRLELTPVDKANPLPAKGGKNRSS